MKKTRKTAKVNIGVYKELNIEHPVSTENSWLKQGKLVRELIFSSMTSEMENKIMEELASTGVDFILPRYQIMLVRINDFRIMYKKAPLLNIEAELKKIRNIIMETFSGKEMLVCFIDEELHLVILRNFKKTEDFYEITCVKNIQKKVKEELGFSLTVSCGTEKETVRALEESYREANLAMFNSTGYDREPLLRYHPEKQKLYRFYEKLYKEESEFIKCLVIGDKKKVTEQLNKLFNRAEKMSFYFWQLKYFCIRIIMTGVYNLDEMGVFCVEYYRDISELINKINLCDSRTHLKKIVVEIFDKVGYAVNETLDADKSQILVRKALRYIEQYYSQEICVQNLAEMLKITPNYFSKIFKKYTNNNFIDYLNRLRIKKAMTLLKQTSLKIYQVSEMVGYSNYKYFTQVFRRYTKYTPKNFRNLPSYEKIDL